ncbi:MAG TPA: CDP-diacylglycerol--glycerol-3-phosphate 3-phosphatidyltransferase [Rickettsiales bacterium]|nr:CDP-diacylglycerol--glycerol-3-phosphate 3-phosphatidyltransferase [Rickettsiales bacterium]
MQSLKNKIPNLLTVVRIVLIPVIIYSFYVSSQITNIIVASLFLGASITDYFDGYLARAMKVQSNFGKCLDPIADKLLVAVSLIMLVNFSDNNLFILIPAIIIICREIMVSGLREFLATINVGVPVTRLAKWKTAIQMVAITALLLAGNGSDYVYNEIMDIVEAEDYIRISLEGIIQSLGELLLCISAFMTIITGYAYFKTGFKNF